MRSIVQDKNFIRNKIGNRPPLVHLFIIGFALGVIIMNLNQRNLLIDTGVLDEYTLFHLKYINIDADVFFFYILGKRFQSLFWILLLSTTYLGIIIVWGYAFGVGVSFGLLLSASIIRYGIKGIALVFIGIFPQQLLMFPMFIFLLYMAYEICLSIYFKDLYTGSFLLKSQQTFWKRVMYIFFISLVMFFACILESYVNPKLLLEFLKVF